MLDFNEIIKAVDDYEQDRLNRGSKQGRTLDAFLADVLTTFYSTVDMQQLAVELKAREDKLHEETGYNLPLGLVIVAGPGASGKSTFVRKMADEADTDGSMEVVSMGETGSILPYSLKETLDLAKPLTAGAYSPVQVIDSWKDVWNDWRFSDSPLQSGGIYTSLNASLGLLSQCLFLAGVCLVVVMNPQTSGEKETVYQMMNTQAAGFIRLRDENPGEPAYAQGRLIDRDYQNGKIKAGIPTQRAEIFDVQTAPSQPSGFAGIFTRPII